MHAVRNTVGITHFSATFSVSKIALALASVGILWDLPTGCPLMIFRREESIRAVALAGDASYCVLAREVDNVRLMDCSSGRLVRNMACTPEMKALWSAKRSVSKVRMSDQSYKRSTGV